MYCVAPLRSGINLTSSLSEAMRGAYKSAYQTYAEVVRGVLEAKVAGQAVSRTQLESATLILWQLCLQSGERGAIVEGRENLVVLADILPAWQEILAEGDSLPSWLVMNTIHHHMSLCL